MSKNKPLKNKEEAFKYCIDKDFSKEESKSIVNELWDYCSENDLKPTIDKLDSEIDYFLKEKEYKKQEEEWKKRSIWKKIIFDNDRKLRAIIIFFIVISLFCLVFLIPLTYSFLRTYYIGKECPLGTEPSWLKRSCVEVVCNGGAIDEKGVINEKRLYFLDTFIYQNSGNGLRTTGCISKCTDLDEEYYQNNVISTKSSFGDNRRPSYYYYYYWKDGQCNLLQLRRQREDQVRASENKELADKIKQEEEAIKQHFLRILEGDKEYYKKAHYNY